MTEKKKRGRPRLHISEIKRNRSLTMTDSEWNDLYDRAWKAGKSIGSYIAEQLNLKTDS